MAKLLNEPDKSDRIARIDVDGAGLVLPLTTEEAEVLADDAARRVLAQLKSAGVRGRVRVEFEVTAPDGTGDPRLAAGGGAQDRAGRARRGLRRPARPPRRSRGRGRKRRSTTARQVSENGAASAPEAAEPRRRRRPSGNFP